MFTINIDNPAQMVLLAAVVLFLIISSMIAAGTDNGLFIFIIGMTGLITLITLGVNLFFLVQANL